MSMTLFVISIWCAKYTDVYNKTVRDLNDTRFRTYFTNNHLLNKFTTSCVSYL
jgi:hypothetical protein